MTRRLRAVGGAVFAAVVAVALSFVAPPLVASAATFTAGLTTITGTSDDWGNNNGMSATQVTTGATGGNLTGVSLYVGTVQAAPANHGQVAVYADANNLPGAKLVASGSQVLTAKSWNNFALSGMAVTSSTRYWLVFNVDGANTKYKITSGGRAAWKIPTAFGTWPATFGVPSPAANTERYAINMTWTDTGAPPPPAACGDGQDNDADGKVDFPADLGCTSAADTDETDSPPPPPPPSGFPDATNTGVPAGTTLAAYTGPCQITTATVIDSKTVNCPGGLDIKAAVQITKSKVNGHVWLDTDLAGSSGWSLTLTDSEVDAGTVQLPAVGIGNLTVTRSNIHGGQTAVQCDGGTVCTVQDSWLHGQSLAAGSDWHAGGFLSDGGDINIRLIHNRVVCDAPVTSADGGCTGDINLIPNFAATSDVLIQNNLLGANSNSSYCTYGGEKSTSQYPHGDHIVYQDNVFERGSSNKCAAYGPVTDFNPNGVGNQWINNLWTDGTPVSPT